MKLSLDFVQGQCFPPTNRAPEHGKHGEHFPPYTAADLDRFKSGSDPILARSKVNVTATIHDAARGTGPDFEITPADVERLAKAGKPVGEIAFFVNGEPAERKSANDTNRFNTRVDVPSGSDLTIAVECEGQRAEINCRVVEPNYPTEKA